MMHIAIIGSGPAGSAAAILLAKAGARVTLLDDGKRPDMVVGESLVPAVVPLLQRLGIEEEIAQLGCVKPGASFIWSPSVQFEFNFARFAPDVPPYAYNVPRPQFDNALAERAAASGVCRVQARAKVVPRAGNGAEIELSPETLALAPSLEGRQPDFVIDASGRARRIARALSIPARIGPRDDVACFAHFTNARWDYPPGQIVVMRLAAGWSWCIPLKDCLSVGIVAGRDYWAGINGNPGERLVQALAAESTLHHIVRDATRISPVATYTNYQLVSERAYGRGWAAIGDAYGFVDPMLSPGVFLSLRSAERIADALTPFILDRASSTALERNISRYAAEQARMLDAWMELIGYFYDGRLPAMVDAGHDWMKARPGKIKSALQNHIEREMALLACGVGTTSRYSRGLLRFLGRHGLRGRVPATFAIQ
jgi:flavin-dependent dehydrogenase